MSVKRTYQYRLKLNNQNIKIIDHNLKNCCWLYNYLLEQFRERDKNKEKQLTERELQNVLPQIKERYPFLKQVKSHVLQDVAKRVYKTWKKYLELKVLNPEKGYPNFKPIHRYNSFVYPQPIVTTCGYKLDNSPLVKKTENRKLRLSLGRQNNHNIQILTNLKLSRNLQGNCKTLTIKRKNNQYYALFSCDNVPLKPLPKTGKLGGFDLGIKHLLISAEGKKIKNPKFYKKAEKKITETQRILSRKEITSKNWLKTKDKLSKQWEKTVNQFKHYIHQEVNKIVKNYDVIKVEDLNVKGMLTKKIGDNKNSLRRSLMGTKFGITLKTLAEAAEIATRQLVKVNPANTSQTCSSCSELAQTKLTLWDRTFKCWSCFLELDRDINAARNIRDSNEFDRNLPLNKEEFFEIA